MVKNITNKIKVLTLLFATLFISNSCSDLLNNPMQDKETGENIPLLLLDLNVFDTKINVHLVNNETGDYIVGDEITVAFDGKDADKLVTMLGDTLSRFTVKNGLLEIALDPNYTPSAENPIELFITAWTEDDKWFSLHNEIVISEIGTTDIVVEMFAESTGGGEDFVPNPSDDAFLKSAYTNLAVPSFVLKGENYPNGAVKKYDFHYIQSGIEYFYFVKPSNLSTLMSPRFYVSSSTVDPKLISDYGYNGYYYASNNRKSTLATSKLTTDRSFTQIKNFRFYAAQKSTSLEKCSSGLTIKIKQPENKQGTCNFDYKLTLSNGQVINGKVSGTFKASNSYTVTKTINPIYYPKANSKAKLEILPNSFYNLDKTAVDLNTPCGQTVEVKAIVKESLVDYKIITTISCESGNVGAAPTMLGKVAGPGLSAPQAFNYEQGIATLKLLPNETYTISGSYNGTSAEFKFTTKNDKAAINKVIADAKAAFPELYNVTVVFAGKDPYGAEIINIGVIFTKEECPF